MKNQYLILLNLVWTFCLLLLPAASFAQSPDLLLAKIYNKTIMIENYLVSEKLDGVRAYWNGKNLMSRRGNIFYAPKWFTKDFPEQALDGELWIKRNSFEQVLSTVRKHTPIDKEWRQIHYMLFELPDATGIFSERVTAMEALITSLDIPHLKVIKQYRLQDHKTLMLKLDEVTEQGAEGLMLHRANALYHSGRSEDLLKVKKHQDAEAQVLRYIEGKGKFKGMLGALVVEDNNGLKFKIGTGFSHLQRENPPAIGTLVTYKYFGRTKKGLPRFASFMRVKSLTESN